MRKATCLVLVLALVGCYVGDGRICCDDIATLLVKIGKGYTPEAFREWVAQTYRLPLESVTVEARPDERLHVVRWQKRGVEYSAGLEQGILMDVGLASGRVSADRVIACLGQPARYRAHYDWNIPGNHLSLDLIFPEQGVLVHGWRFFRSRPKRPAPIKSHFPIRSFFLTQPASVEQILYEIYGGKPSGLYEQMLQEYKPWPGAWEDIVIEIDPNLQQ